MSRCSAARAWSRIVLPSKACFIFTSQLDVSIVGSRSGILSSLSSTTGWPLMKRSPSIPSSIGVCTAPPMCSLSTS